MFRTASILLAAAAMSGCERGPWTLGHITDEKAADLNREVTTRGLIVSLEGMQPFSWHYADDMAALVAGNVGLAHSATSGNYQAHLPFIEQAHRNSQPVFIVGYSIGGDQARLLAVLCKEKGIPIRVLFLIDPGYLAAAPGKVPDNVEKAIFYTGRDYDVFVNKPPGKEHLEDPKRTAFVGEDFPFTCHADMPMHVAEKVEAEVRAAMQRPATRPR